MSTGENQTLMFIKSNANVHYSKELISMSPSHKQNKPVCNEDFSIGVHTNEQLTWLGLHRFQASPNCVLLAYG